MYFSIKVFPSIEDAIKGELPTVAMPYRSKKSKETIIEIINNKNIKAGYLKYKIKFRLTPTKHFRDFDDSQYS